MEFRKNERAAAIVKVKEACERARTAHAQISRKTFESTMNRNDHEVLDLLLIARNEITEAVNEWSRICKMHRNRGESKTAKTEEQS